MAISAISAVASSQGLANSALQSAANATQSSSSAASLSAATSSRLQIDLTALGSAIDSGNIESAKDAYSVIQGDLSNIPSEQLAKSDSGITQTVHRADMLIQFMNAASTGNKVDLYA